MPRLHPRLFWQAYAIDSLLPQLLPVCRDIRSAQNELRWLADHSNAVLNDSSKDRKTHLFHHYVRRRARGEPLQYILGSEFFGDLEIECRPGVLIPRQETATSISHLVRRLKNVSLPPALRVLDLCTGTGCIPLLFHHEFYSKPINKDVSLQLMGVDISSVALHLARENHTAQLQAHGSAVEVDSLQQQSLRSMTFVQADVLHNETSPDTSSLLKVLQAQRQTSTFDILTSNPPYISLASYHRTTSPSVRRFEPKLALVPPVSDQDGDQFYSSLLQTAIQTNAQLALFEVADLAQAQRVAGMAAEQGVWKGLEIWRAEPQARSRVDVIDVAGRDVRVFGEGHGRSVVLHRGDGTQWLKQW